MTDEEDQRDPSNPGRRDYDDLAKKVTVYIDKTDHRLHRFFVGAIIAFSIIGLATSASLVGFSIVLNAQKDTADQLEKLVESNRQFAKDIQAERRDSIARSCKQQNARNKATKDALVAGSDEDQANAANEAARAEIRRRRDVTLALIDALAPAEDCKAAVEAAVKEG